jgi:hypothetical protein
MVGFEFLGASQGCGAFLLLLGVDWGALPPPPFGRLPRSLIGKMKLGLLLAFDPWDPAGCVARFWVGWMIIVVLPEPFAPSFQPDR